MILIPPITDIILFLIFYSNFTNGLCRCDNLCSLYEDCCLDAAEKLGGSLESKNSFQCLKYEEYGVSWSDTTLYFFIKIVDLNQIIIKDKIYMITTCPPSFNDPVITSKCQKMSIPYTYHLDIPVKSRKTHLVRRVVQTLKKS